MRQRAGRWRTLALTNVPRDPGSLTAALRRVGTVSVQVLHQGRAPLDPDERRVLGAAAARGAVVREVLLYCAGRPVVYARTAVARAALRGAWRVLEGLGSKALGDLIFIDPVIQRGGFVLRRLSACDLLFRHARGALMEHAGTTVSPAQIHGARRCLIVRRRRGIVLTEVFLPDFPPRFPPRPEPER